MFVLKLSGIEMVFVNQKALILAFDTNQFFFNTNYPL